MENEFLFFIQEPLEFPLDESITVVNSLPEDKYIVANIKSDKIDRYAHEINYYIKNTKDSIANKIENIRTLYEARIVAYGLAQDIDYTQEVGKKVLIISGDKEDKLIEKLEQDGYVCATLHPDEINDINGHIGKLSVATTKLLRGDLQTDQIVWQNAPAFAMKQSGVYDPSVDGWDKVIDTLYKNSNIYHYKNYVHYDPNICQYNERILSETCGKCEEVCPTVAIVKIDEQKHLEFSDIDCHGCGGCVSVCPSGALDFTQMPRDALIEVASFYKNHKILLLPSGVEIDDVLLPKGVLPLGIDGRKYLHEAHFMTLLQKSGNAVIFYTDFVSKGTGDAIRIINEIFDRKYSKKAIYICQNKEELEKALSKAESIEECRFDFDDSGMRKRESFTYRLAHLVGDDNLGVVETGEHIHYGNIVINEDKCTLCMSCVGACNVAAFTAHPEDQTLKFNPSICTNCGYCEVVCPEDECLSIVYDKLALRPDYFTKNTMAQDELFACVECGVEFATKKSIEKIASMMIPRFGDNEAKIRTLYCCAECKPKVMLQAEMDQSNKENSNG